MFKQFWINKAWHFCLAWRLAHIQPAHLQPAHLQPAHLQPAHLQPAQIVIGMLSSETKYATYTSGRTENL